MKYFKLGILFVFFLSVLNCTSDSTDSLQTYYVDNQEKPNFIVVDIPTSVVDFSKVELTSREQEAVETIEKINFLGFKKSNTNSEEYQKELKRINTILSHAKFSALGTFNMYGSKVMAYSLGSTDNPEELIVFANQKDKGFGVLRVLGDDLNFGKLFTLAEILDKANIDKTQLEGITNFFKD